MASYQRYNRTPKMIYKDQETYGIWAKPSFLTSQLDNSFINTFIVTPQYAGRPDLISNAVYNTPYFDWAIISYNKVTDTLNWPPSGLIIKYPSFNVVSGA